MLSSIMLKNYKAFSLLPSTEIKPITVLCGSNSCGKTSMMQSLLLLKQTLESNYSVPLLFDGPFAHLCDFHTMVHGQKAERSISVSHTFDFSRYEWIVSQEDIPVQLGWLFPRAWILSQGLDPDLVKLSIELMIEFDCPDINPDTRAKLRKQSYVDSKNALSSKVLAQALRGLISIDSAAFQFVRGVWFARSDRLVSKKKSWKGFGFFWKDQKILFQNSFPRDWAMPINRSLQIMRFRGIMRQSTFGKEGPHALSSTKVSRCAK